MKNIGRGTVLSLVASIVFAHPHFNKTVTATLSPGVEVTITYNTTPARNSEPKWSVSTALPSNLPCPGVTSISMWSAVP